MEQRALPGGLVVSMLGLGCNNLGGRLDEEQSVAVVQAALDAGVTHFDTAEMYSEGRSEEILGRALASRRDDVVIATKALPRPQEVEYAPGVLARSIIDGCERSLRRLGTDRIDLYYQHFPDPIGPIDEALEALEALRSAGKVRAVAVSNHSAQQMADAAASAVRAGRPEPVVNQVEWSLLSRDVEAEVVPTATRLGQGIVPYFPLASGLLSGKYRPGRPFPTGSRLDRVPSLAGLATPANIAYVQQLDDFAEERGHTVLELAIAWLCSHPIVPSVIAGAMSPEQVHANAVGAQWRLTKDDLAALPRRSQ